MSKDKETTIVASPAASVASEPSDSYLRVEKDLSDLRQRFESALAEIESRVTRLRDEARG